MKEIPVNDFKVTSKISLATFPTKIEVGASQKKILKKLNKISKELSEIQNVQYAHGKYAVLICIQGMDTSGKDSLIREVFKEFNVRGVVSHSFKEPTLRELRHNFLWRHNVALPERGKYGVFNRTHYENVLISRVHPELVIKENIPGINKVEDIDDAFWEQRFDQINNFEKTIAESGTIIFKFFLNISKEEQKERLIRRLDKKSKNWKFSPGDLEERKLWDEYMKYYEEAINKSSIPHAPWFIIPADDKDTARYLVAKILLEVMQSYTDIQNPELPEEIQDQISNYKKQLLKD